MALFNPFKRKEAGDSGAAPPLASVDQVQQARRRARQRLVGAVVLLGAGIIGFPLLFETAPRPIPVDLPIEIPRKDAVAPLAVPTARGDVAVPKPAAPATASGTVTVEAPAEPARDAAAPAPRGTAPAPLPLPATASVAPAPVPADPPPPAASAPARASETKPAGAASGAADAAATGRYVVQVGAYAESAALQQARAKVERLGLKTYTQVIETDAGKRTRVRVGPFASRDEADKAAARLKGAGLPAAILVL